MKWNQVKILGIVVALSVTVLAGCGEKESEVQGTVSTEEQTTTESEETEENTMFVQVTAVDGNTITAVKGEMTQSQKPEMGEKPEGESKAELPEMGEKPEGETSENEPPELGEKEDGAKPEMGEKPEGEIPEGDMPERGERPSGGHFEAGNESMEFTVTDETKITIESLEETQEGTIDDIAVDSVLELTLDEEGNAETVLIKNLNGKGGFGGSNQVTNGTAANTISEDSKIEDTTYTSTGDDENALRVDGAEVELNGITVEKTAGESSNTENGDFYGQNAGFLALNGANVTMKNVTVTTSVVNGNGVFSYGEGTSVNISDSVIRTTENNSGGIQTTGGGTMIATNLDVETQGNSAAAIRSDRGGGTVNVNGGSYVTNGTGSPAVYCTADIIVEDASLLANASEGVVVEGKNSVTLLNCDLTSEMTNTYNGDEEENIHGIMIYQSMSGDAEVGEASFRAEGGSITAKSGDFIYVTNTACTIGLKEVNCTLANDTFLRVEGNSSKRGWGTEGENGGDVVLNAEKQQIDGDIIVDEISSLKLSLADGSTLTGVVNEKGEAGTVEVTLSDDSTWELTGDSYITSFDGNVSNIIGNGYHVYVNGEAINE